MIVRSGGAIWLNPFATVLFNGCSAVTVECCVLYPYYVGVFGMFAVMLCPYPVSLQLLRGETCMGALVYIFIFLGWGTMLATVHMYGIMLVLRAVSNMLMRNASTRGTI